jgi:GT2 family glycosyltransferase
VTHLRTKSERRPRKSTPEVIPSGLAADPLAAEATEVTAQETNFIEGSVEGYAWQDAAECLVLYGWASRQSMALDEWVLTVVFHRCSVSAPALVAFHDRADLGARDVGFVALLSTGAGRLGDLLRVELVHHQLTVAQGADGSVQGLAGRSVVEHAASILPTCFVQPNTALVSTLLARRFVGGGYIDAYGYHSASAGWFVNGWISNDWIDSVSHPVEAIAHFDGGRCTGTPVLNYFDRPDIRGTGMGVVLHVVLQGDTQGQLLNLVLVSGEAAMSLRPAQPIERIPSVALSGSLSSLINDSEPTPSRLKLRNLISRAAFEGRDTVADLPDRILCGLEETIYCGQEGVILIGWLLTKPGTIKAMRLRSGDRIFTIDSNAALWVERPDVADGVGRDHGFEDRRCGFIMHVLITPSISGEFYLEIETQAGDIGFKPVPRPRLEGITAIKRILSGVETQYNDVDSIYDHILGPAVGALNAQRLQTPVQVQTRQFGVPVQLPRHSIIVPLYGRIDFMEFQLALFATHRIGRDVEIIYVLDDPPRMRETQFLAASLFERFRVSFKLLCLSHNLGFAPANNVGVRASSGDYICFMNSDVFPTSGDWLDRLAAHLEADPTLGMVAPVLLFEDDSVQHQGIAFKNLPQFGNWAFPQHKRKGLRVPAERGLVREMAITGAFMLLRREDVMAHGAFDEAFIIGDFEDTDLCLRLRERGLGVAVDFDVAMHHLERKSQAGSESLWRANLTLYNAWVHHGRWAETIRRLETAA